MIDGLVKIVQGIFKLRGNTDQTLIGNVGDRLKVDAAITTPGSFNMQFIKDGIIVDVEEDTGAPSNNVPLPVKLTGITGDITITANDLNVSLSHVNDSVKLGDGTTLAGVTLANELKTNDAGANSLLTTIDGDTSSISSAIDVTLSTRASEVTLSAINGKLNTLGQKPMATSVPVVIASDQSTLNTNIIGANTANINSTISVGITSTQLLASNSNRKIAYIVNNSNAKIFLKFGTAAIAGEGLSLAANDVMYIGVSFLWTGSVNAIKASGAAVNIEVFEGTL